MRFFPSSGCINTTVQMHHTDTDKTYREKAKWELHKNATSYKEQIREAIPHEKTAVWPLTSHLQNHPNKMNKTYRTLLKKQG